MSRFIVPSFTSKLAISESQSLWLDLLRCVLLAQVVLGHLAAIALPTISQMVHIRSLYWFGVPYCLVTRFGRESAFVFVYLSGFFVGGPLLTEALHRAPRPFGEFIHHRLLRILPTLTLALLVTALADWLGLRCFDLRLLYATSYRACDLTGHTSAVVLLGNLLCLQPTFVHVFGSNGPLWTLGYIVQFYLAGFFAVRLGLRSKQCFAAVVLALSCIVLVRVEWVILFTVWMVGAFVRNWKIPRIPASICFAAFLILFVVSNLLPPLASATLACITGPFATYGALGIRISFPKILSSIVRHVASLSYSGYASHFPVAFLIFSLFFKRQAHSFNAFLMMMGGCLTAVYLISLIIWRGDRALRKMINNCRRSPLRSQQCVAPSSR